MSDGRTSFSRNDARSHWAASGLTYVRLTTAALERLRSMVDAEMQSGEYLRGTFRATKKAKRLRCGSVDLRCEAWYFKGRQCITFEPSGFIGFAGWSDDTNIQPIIRAFMAWVDELKVASQMAV